MASTGPWMLTDALKEYVQIGSSSAGEYMHDPGEAPRHHGHKRRRQTDEVRHPQDDIELHYLIAKLSGHASPVNKRMSLVILGATAGCVTGKIDFSI